MAKACKSALASAALPAAVKQADAAVRATIDLLVLQVGRAPTARADALGQARQGQVIAKFLAALQVGQCLGLFLLRGGGGRGGVGGGGGGGGGVLFISPPPPPGGLFPPPRWTCSAP